MAQLAVFAPRPSAAKSSTTRIGIQGTPEESADVRRTLTIRLSHVMGLLWLGVFAVVLLSLTQDLLIFFAPEVGFSDRIYRLDLDTEASLPTWLSVGLMLLCALSLLFIAAQARPEGRRRALPWFLLALIFFTLSLDESVQLHEWLSAFLGARIENTGLFHFIWTVPALAICLAGLICFVPFILSFKGIDRYLLVGSAVVFLSGAIGIEMLGGAEAEVAGIESLRYRMLATIEESLEFTGILIFLLFILRQLRSSYNRATLCFK